MEFQVELYKKDKVVGRLTLIMSKERFLKQLKKGVIFFTNNRLQTEIFYLNNYEKVIVVNKDLYEDLWMK